MSNVDFGNEAEMAQADKLHPSLGPTEGSQDVANRNRQVVPMPQFTDPNRPLASSGSVNLALADHPVEHAEDYGKLVPADDVASVQGLHAKELQGVEASREMTVGADGSQVFPPGTSLPDGGGGAAKESEKPRAEWNKADWVDQAAKYGLAKSGNTDAVKGRVEEYEAAQAERSEYEDSLRKMDESELYAEADEYDIDADDYDGADALITAILAAKYDDGAEGEQ